jgi:hypothetical protein
MAPAINLMLATLAALAFPLHNVASAAGPSVTHERSDVRGGKGAHTGYMSARDNITHDIFARTTMEDAVARSVSLRTDPASIFRRQVDTPGDGALLCPTGKCPDGR